MSKRRFNQLDTTLAHRVLSVALCAAVASFGAVPIASAAGADTSTTFAEDAAGDTAGADQGAADDSGADSGAADDSSKTDDGGSTAGKKDDSQASSGSSKKDTSAKTPVSSLEDLTKKQSSSKLKKSARERAKLASAKEAIQEVNSLAARMETAYEDLAQEQKRLKKLKKEIKSTKQDIRNTDKSLAQAKQRVSQWAKTTYTSGGVRYMSVLLSATSFSDFVSRWDFMTAITAEEERLVQEIEQLQQDLSDSNKNLLDKYAEQKRLTASVSANANVIQNSLIEQANYFSALPESVRKKVLAYDGVANSLSAAAGVTGSTSKKGSHPEVVKAALKYLGVKYVWGGEDPSGFDCSGLTMYVYKKVTGKSLTHFARTQYSEGTKIAKSALMPGDLVFFGETVEGIHHVGIYMGNDKFIHAPHTGDVVKISTLSSRSDYIGACRP